MACASGEQGTHIFFIITHFLTKKFSIRKCTSVRAAPNKPRVLGSDCGNPDSGFQKQVNAKIMHLKIIVEKIEHLQFVQAMLKQEKTAVIIYLQACPGKPRFSWISPDFQREPNYSLL